MTNMKRSLSDSEGEDFYDDVKGSPSQSCHGSDRKKRRGIIEKRRRDRINNSLAELRRLVPAAFEKQGSAKLEKAEILQMTVDHLKILQQKGINGYNYDHAALAMDYRSMGFRECATEVARYLVTAEGMDIQDPLRLRMMSHLQCYSAQREAAKSSLASNPWTQHPYGTNSVGSMPHAPQEPQHPMSHHTGLSSGLSSGLASSLTSGLSNIASCSEPSRLSQHNHHLDSHNASSMGHMRLPTTGSVAPHVQMSAVSTSVSTPVSHAQAVLPGLSQMHSQFLNVNTVGMLSPTGGHHGYNHPNTSALSQLGQSQIHSSMKPYRPWGAELAY